MGACYSCYSYIAIAHPYPGGFSRNGVEKVWLHRSFLATLECVDAVKGGADRNGYAAAAIMQWRLMVKGHRIQLIRFPQAETAAWDAFHNLLAKRLLRLRRQLIAYKLLIIDESRALPVGFLPLAE